MERAAPLIRPRVVLQMHIRHTLWLPNNVHGPSSLAFSVDRLSLDSPPSSSHRRNATSICILYTSRTKCYIKKDCLGLASADAVAIQRTCITYVEGLLLACVMVWHCIWGTAFLLFQVFQPLHAKDDFHSKNSFVTDP